MSHVPSLDTSRGRHPFLCERWLRNVMIIFLATLLLRLVAMVLVPLIPEEAYYWMYAQHPNLSYYDHPPMVAWVIGLGTAIFGDNEFGVRVVGNLMMVGASLLMYQFGRMWFSRAAGVLSALLLHVLPMYFGVGFIATMDSALVFFWMLCMVGVSFALRKDRTWGWYVAGAALGAAMLSKYTGVFLAAGTFAAVVVHRPWRRHLLTIHPYLAVVLAAALFSPVVIWNAQHDWASFWFQFVDRFARKSLSFRFVLIFLLYQLMAVTPLLLWGCAAFYARMFRTRRRLLTPRWLVTVCFSLPLLSVMAYKSLRYEVHINWTLPLFLSLFPALSHLFVVRLRQLRTAVERRRWSGAFEWTAMICILINVSLVIYLLALQPRLRWISAFGPWQELARIVEHHEDELERESGREPLIIAEGKYRLASVLAFYRRPIEHDVDASDYTTSRWIFGGKGLGFPYWTEREHWRGRDCIYVVDDANDDILDETKTLFDSVEIVHDPRLDRLGVKGEYRIAICRGLRPFLAQPTTSVTYRDRR